MEGTQYLYLMLSRTGTGIGRAIRLFTNYEYNHVSLSLDPEFRQWVSFARYRQDVPLAGGFVEETPERFFSSGSPVQVKIFRVEVSPLRAEALRALFARAGHPESGLIYNTFSPLANLLGTQVHIPGAYTCLEFADAVLEESHISLRALEACHRPQLIYEGPLQELVGDSGSREGSYFVQRGFWGGTVDTSLHFARLMRRLFFGSFPDPISAALH